MEPRRNPPPADHALPAPDGGEHLPDFEPTDDDLNLLPDPDPDPNNPSGTSTLISSLCFT